MSSPPSAHAGRMGRPAGATTTPHRPCSDGRRSPAPWRRRGLRLQPAPHCRLPSAAAFLQKYELGAQLGRGNFGTVWEARERATGRTWAAKVVAKSSNRMKMLLLTREIQVLKMVEHPNIVYLREILETAENVYLILELCEHGELAKFWKHKGKISEKDARTIISGISNAIQYLHKHGIVHRDLKLENVLLASPREDSSDPDSSPGQPCAKLSDFGLAEVKDKRDHDHMMELFCGTPYCMAPEILSERAYSQQCDVWSMGVILYSLITGSSPYMGGSERDVLYSIHRHPHLQDDPALTTVTEGARDLLSRMLHLDPAYRITAAEVVAHPWITDKCTQASASQDILTLMKEWRTEEADRTDPSDARRSPDTTPPGQAAGTQTAETERQPTETPRTTAGNSSTRSSSSAGGQSSSAGGQSASGSGRGASGGAAQRGRGGGSAGGSGSRKTGKLSSSGSDPTVRPSSGSSTAGCVRRSCPAAVSTTALGGGRPWSGPRVSTPTVPARRPTPPVTVVARRRSAAGVPPRPIRDSAVTPHTPERPDTPQPRTGSRRTTGPTPPPTATERARLT